MNISTYIEGHEGRRYKRYKDIAGCWTIGVGHNLDAKGLMGIVPPDRDLDNVGITDDEIDTFLACDISTAMFECREKLSCFESLDANRQLALLDMVFNMGIGSSSKMIGVLGFPRMLAALKAGDWQAAADDLKDSRYYHEVGQRAIDNYNLLLNG